MARRRKRTSCLGALFGITRSWQKGQQYARNAMLLEERTRTERVRQKQIRADIRMKNARSAILEAMLKGGKGKLAPNDITLLGCEPCAIYDLNDTNATHCDVCGRPLTHTTINLKG